MDVCLKKKKFLAQRGVIVNDDRKLRARQKRANEFSSVSLAREILNATTDLKLSSETLTDYPTHAVLLSVRRNTVAVTLSILEGYTLLASIYRSFGKLGIQISKMPL